MGEGALVMMEERGEIDAEDEETAATVDVERGGVRDDAEVVDEEDRGQVDVVVVVVDDACSVPFSVSFFSRSFSLSFVEGNVAPSGGNSSGLGGGGGDGVNADEPATAARNDAGATEEDVLLGMTLPPPLLLGDAATDANDNGRGWERREDVDDEADEAAAADENDATGEAAAAATAEMGPNVGDGCGWDALRTRSVIARAVFGGLPLGRRAVEVDVVVVEEDDVDEDDEEEAEEEVKVVAVVDCFNPNRSSNRSRCNCSLVQQSLNGAIVCKYRQLLFVHGCPFSQDRHNFVVPYDARARGGSPSACPPAPAPPFANMTPKDP